MGHRAMGHRPEWDNHSGITSALPDPSRVARDTAKVTPARDGHGSGADDAVTPVSTRHQPVTKGEHNEEADPPPGRPIRRGEGDPWPTRATAIRPSVPATLRARAAT